MATTKIAENSALVIIDIQVGMIESERANHTIALANICTLLERARASTLPIIYIQHDGPEGHGLARGSENWQIHPAITPRAGEIIVHKTASDGFHKTSFHTELQRLHIQHLIVTGGQTDYCVDTTVRRATTFGYDVTLVSDSHLTYDGDTLNEAQIVAFYNETLAGFQTDEAMVRVVPTEELLFPLVATTIQQ